MKTLNTLFIHLVTHSMRKKLLNLCLTALLGAKVFLKLDMVWLAWPISFVAGTIFPFIVYQRMFHGVSDRESEQQV